MSYYLRYEKWRLYQSDGSLFTRRNRWEKWRIFSFPFLGNDPWKGIYRGKSKNPQLAWLELSNSFGRNVQRCLNWFVKSVTHNEWSSEVYRWVVRRRVAVRTFTIVLGMFGRSSSRRSPRDGPRFTPADDRNSRDESRRFVILRLASSPIHAPTDHHFRYLSCD